MNKSIIWAIIIFVCAATFRLTFLDLMEFKLDEARDVYEMNKFYQNPYLIQRGTIQSTGVYNPPLWYYILAVIALPSRNPQYLSFMIALLNCTAVAGFYLVVRKFYGQGLAVAAGLLLAFSPWSILMSRKIWAPDMILLLLVPLFYFIHVLFTPGESKPPGESFRLPSALRAGPPGVSKKWTWFWIVLLLSLLAQLHASGIFLAVASLVALVVIRPKISWKYALVGLLISLIPLLPYIAYQLQTGCEDCQNFFNYQSEAKTFDGNVFLRTFELISGSSFQIVLGDDYENFIEAFPFIKLFNIIFLAEFILAILGIIYIIKKEKKLWWMFIFLSLVPLLYLISQTPAYMYYFVILLPIMILIYGLGINSLSRIRKNLWIPTFVGMTVVVINIVFNLCFIQFLDQKQTIQGDYGPIYRVSKKQAEEKGMKVEEWVISQYK